MRNFFRILLTWLVLSAVAVAQPATRGAGNNGELVLGPNDVIKVAVYQNPDLTLETRVSEKGTISFPLIGTVQVGGLTISQAEQRIADALRRGNFVNKPQVNISMTQVRSNLVSILGQVGKPGRYPIEPGTQRISEVIATAGGVLPTASETITLVGTRNGKALREEIDIASLLASRGDKDVAVQNGDILYVDRAPQYYIYGEVQRPGVGRLERGMTVMQALAQAGGPTLRGTTRGLAIHRRDANGNLEVIKPGMNDPVQRDDVIYVRESLF